MMVILGYFFFPKDAGSTCGFCPGPPHIHRTEYGCIGIKIDVHPGSGCMDCGTKIVCFGIATSEKKCYTSIKGTNVEILSCENPNTWQEILDVCSDCYLQASFAAISVQNDLTKAIEICNSIPSSEEKDRCIFRLFDEELGEGNLDNAENICFNYLGEEYTDRCLQGMAEKIAESDVESGVNACKNINRMSNRDACYHNIAVKTREINITRALQICGMIEETEYSPPCEELIEKYCEIYNC